MLAMCRQKEKEGEREGCERKSEIDAKPIPVDLNTSIVVDSVAIECCSMKS